MRKKFISLVVLIFTLGTVAQDSKFSASMSYPIAVGDNFVNRYNGVIDLGIQYRFTQAGPIKIGASVNATYLNFGFSEGDLDPDARRNAYFLQPRIFGELHLESLKRFKPALGIGYTYVSFSYKNGQENIEIPQIDYNGFNINFACNYDFTNWFFAIAQYEFIRIKIDSGDQIPYNTNLGLLKFGVGVRF